MFSQRQEMVCSAAIKVSLDPSSNSRRDRCTISGPVEDDDMLFARPIAVTISLLRGGDAAGCTITRDIAVRADRPPGPQESPQNVWPIRNSWNSATENLFSAWVQKLFNDPLDATPSWPADRKSVV